MSGTRWEDPPDNGISPKGSAHGGPDWRADPDDVIDPCLTCQSAGCQRCNGTGNEPKPVIQEHRVELLYDRLMLSHTAWCPCGWVGQTEKSMRTAWGHSVGHEHERGETEPPSWQEIAEEIAKQRDEARAQLDAAEAKGYTRAVAVVRAALDVAQAESVQGENAWRDWCTSQSGRVVDHTETTTTTVIVNGKPGVAVGTNTTLYCLSADGRILDIR